MISIKMIDENLKAGLIAVDPHPSHRGFAESVNAQVYPYHRSPGVLKETPFDEALNLVDWPDVNVSIAEGSRVLFPQMIKKHQRPEMISVFLAADQVMYHVFESEENLSSSIIEPYFKCILKKFLDHFSGDGIDGVIAVSEVTAELIRRQLSPNIPVKVVNPYIQPSFHEDICGATPKLDNKVAVTTGRATWYKGVDRLVKIWSKVRDRHPEARLFVIGSGHPNWYSDVSGVTKLGYVDDLTRIYEEASLYIHPARSEAFGVTVIEAMLMGIPALVTDTTGAKTVVENVNKDYIVDSDSDSVAEGVIKHFNKSEEQVSALSSIAMNYAKRYDEESQKNEFGLELHDIVSNVT